MRRAGRRLPTLGAGCAAAYAALALVSGLDRFDGQQTSMTGAAAAVVAQDGARARSSAEEAVRGDPLNPHAVGILGAAVLLTGDADRADRVFASAERLGWRSVVVQVRAFDRLVQAGRWHEAGRHLQALARAHPDLPVTRVLLERMEEEPAGRRALADMIRRRPNLALSYLAGPEAGDATLLTRAGWLANTPGVRIGCAAASPVADRLLQRGFRGPAEKLWRAQCEPAPLPLVADGSLSGLANGAESRPFGWTVHPSGDLSLLVGSGRMPEVVSQASAPRLVLSQPVALRAGIYKVQAGLGQRFRLSLDCGRYARRPVATTGDVLTAPDCPHQTLGLWVAPGPQAVPLPTIALDPL